MQGVWTLTPLPEAPFVRTVKVPDSAKLLLATPSASTSDRSSTRYSAVLMNGSGEGAFCHTKELLLRSPRSSRNRVSLMSTQRSRVYSDSPTPSSSPPRGVSITERRTSDIGLGRVNALPCCMVDILRPDNQWLEFR